MAYIFLLKLLADVSGHSFSSYWSEVSGTKCASQASSLRRRSCGFPP